MSRLLASTLLPCALLLCSGVRAQAESADAPAIGVCEFAISNKLGGVKKEMKAVDKAWAAAFPERQPGARSIACKRNVMTKEELRLNKLVSLGQKNDVRYVIAPAAAKSSTNKKAVEFSVWLVDVAAEKQVGEFSVELPSGNKDFKAAWPAALEEAASAMVTALAGEGGGAPTGGETAPPAEGAPTAANAPAEGAAMAQGEGSEGIAEGSPQATEEPVTDAPEVAPAEAAPPATASKGQSPWAAATAGALVGIGVGAGALVAANFLYGATFRDIETRAVTLDKDVRKELNDTIFYLGLTYDISMGVAVASGVAGVVWGATVLLASEE